MAKVTLNCNGLKCPQPVLKIAIRSRKLRPGTQLEVFADCDEFPEDVKKWCHNNKRQLLHCTDTGGGRFRAEIQF